MYGHRDARASSSSSPRSAGVDADGVGLEAVVRRRGGAEGSGRAARWSSRRGRRPVEELVLGRDVALGVDGEGAQAAGVRCRRVARLRDRRRRGADPRHGLRAEQDRPADGWFVIVRAGPRPAVALAVGVGDEQVRRRAPCRQPRRASVRAESSATNDDLTSAPLSSTFTLCIGTFFGTRTSTSASPSLIRSARLDSVWISKLGLSLSGFAFAANDSA